MRAASLAVVPKNFLASKMRSCGLVYRIAVIVCRFRLGWYPYSAARAARMATLSYIYISTPVLCFCHLLSILLNVSFRTFSVAVKICSYSCFGDSVSRSSASIDMFFAKLNCSSAAILASGRPCLGTAPEVRRRYCVTANRNGLLLRRVACLASGLVLGLT